MSAREFLEWERGQTVRHEFFRGEVFAMAGGSPRHNALSANVTAALVVGLRGKPCRVFSSDQRVAARGTEQYVYADVTVACGPLRIQPGTTDVLENPTCLVEVLSPSTEAYDRGLKWEGYRSIPSLQDYVLVSQDSPRIEHFQRDTDGSWHYRVAESSDVITLSNGATLSVAEIFSGVEELADEPRNGVGSFA